MPAGMEGRPQGPYRPYSCQPHTLPPRKRLFLNLRREEGDEEGPQHEDEGQQSVGWFLGPLAASVGAGHSRSGPAPPPGSPQGVEWQQWVLREHLGGLQGCPSAHLGGEPDFTASVHTCERGAGLLHT